MQTTKRDLITIAVLSFIFFALATWNLGLTQTPVTTAQLSAGQSFYVDLGSVQTVKSVCFLLEVTSGTPEPNSYIESLKWFKSWYF